MNSSEAADLPNPDLRPSCMGRRLKVDPPSPVRGGPAVDAPPADVPAGGAFGPPPRTGPERQPGEQCGGEEETASSGGGPSITSGKEADNVPLLEAGVGFAGAAMGPRSAARAEVGDDGVSQRSLRPEAVDLEL